MIIIKRDRHACTQPFALQRLNGLGPEPRKLAAEIRYRLGPHFRIHQQWWPPDLYWTLLTPTDPDWPYWLVFVFRFSFSIKIVFSVSSPLCYFVSSSDCSIVYLTTICFCCLFVLHLISFCFVSSFSFHSLLITVLFPFNLSSLCPLRSLLFSIIL